MVKIASKTHQILKTAGRYLINSFACEFTARYACKTEQMGLKSTTLTTNGFNLRIINLLMESWGYT